MPLRVFFRLIVILLLLFTFSACSYIEDYIPGQATPTAVPEETRVTAIPTLPGETPTPTAVITATPVIPTATATPAFTPTATVPPKPYGLQPGAVIALPAFTHPDAGCAWMGVGGQVIDENGQPVKDLVIAVSGLQNGAPTEWMGYTGAANAYGTGGFEIQLAGQVSAAQFTIQLFDLNGEALSDPFRFTTSADCQQNLTLVNFSPNLNLQPAIFLPQISN